MVESVTPQQRLYKNSSMQKVLECHEISELLDLRLVSKRFGNELIPKVFKHYKYSCPDDDEQDNKFYKVLQNVNKLEIENISGSETHLEPIDEMAERFGSRVHYLFLSFDGEAGTEEVARKYVNVLRKFHSVDTLRIEVYEDGNFTNICKVLMEDTNFPWF